MATRAFTELATTRGRSVRIVEWTGLLTGDDGQPFPFAAHYNDKAVRVTGTFNGATIIPEGDVALENTAEADLVWAQLRDPSHTLIAITAADLRQILEGASHIRPRVSGGGGSTSLRVRLLLVRK